MEELRTGEAFGPYRVEGLIAGGGMGRVYAARHDVYGSVCAMKVLHSSLHHQEDWRRRFAEEGLVGAQLKHPHVLSAREIVEQDGRIAIIMDLVKGGQTLEKVMSREFPRGLPLAVALQVFLEIVQGIDYLHGKGIVHGDLKPENVMIEGEYRRPETWVAKVTDFGTVGLIAHPVVIDGRTAVVATPRYASPEHLRGVDRIEVRSDVYCLGLLLHFLLSGEHVSDARTVREAALFVMDEVSTVHLVDQPEVVQAVFRRATHVLVDERYPDCRALALAVRDALDGLGVRLELEDVAADLATEVDEDRAAAQREMNEAARAAEDAPPLPPRREDEEEEPDELPTDVDGGDEPPRTFDAGVRASEMPVSDDPPSMPGEPVDPPSMPGEPVEVASPPPPAPRPLVRTPIPPPPITRDEEAEELDTGDSIVDATQEAPLPPPGAQTPKRPPPISAPAPQTNPLVPLAMGIGIVLLLGLAVAAAFL
ncbi:MAG: protein kinase [Myxococcales bacterium]|nr:protein kinase [Myxococcales bacterium]